MRDCCNDPVMREDDGWLTCLKCGKITKRRCTYEPKPRRIALVESDQEAKGSTKG